MIVNQVYRIYFQLDDYELCNCFFWTLLEYNHLQWISGFSCRFRKNLFIGHCKSWNIGVVRPLECAGERLSLLSKQPGVVILIIYPATEERKITESWIQDLDVYVNLLRSIRLTGLFFHQREYKDIWYNCILISVQ